MSERLSGSEIKERVERGCLGLYNSTGLTIWRVALEVADRVVVMNAGKIEQTGTPDEVYDHPATPFVYRFLGGANVLSFEGDREIYIRPHDFEVTTDEQQESIPAQVIGFRSVGAITRIDLRSKNGETLLVEADKRSMCNLQLAQGQTLYVRPRTVKRYPIED